MDTTLKSPIVTHHLSSSYATIVDILADCNIKDLIPSFVQETKFSWPLLLCDHMGKMNITLISSDETEPTSLSLHSSHSEILRAAITYSSSLYTCGDDGQIIQWQPSSSSSSNNSNKNQQQTKSKNRRPY